MYPTLDITHVDTGENFTWSMSDIDLLIDALDLLYHRMGERFDQATRDETKQNIQARVLHAQELRDKLLTSCYPTSIVTSTDD